MSIFFDSIILLYLIASATLGIALFRDRRRTGTWESRHKLLAISCSVVLLFSFLVVIWGSFIEPRLITVKTVQIDLPNFEPTQPVRAALISDVHVGTYKKGGWIQRVSKRIIAEQPDLVLIAGDLIVSKPEHAQYLSSFSILNSSFPTYAVLGDHDYHVNHGYTLDPELASAVEEELIRAGIQVMHNEARKIEINDATFWLLGLDDWLAGKTDLPHALSQLTNQQINESPIVALIHNPDFILDPEFTAKAGQAKKADLILAGNTHGGQIRLPFIGAVSRLPSKLPRAFDKGLFDITPPTPPLPPLLTSPRAGEEKLFLPLVKGELEGVQKRYVFITSGISESGPRARLFNPPEIVILEFN
ncbi:metallophosphoesterase family protein [Candidatus Uhrbacteria bacterium]|nr:metallophosphoesterase family protein [Candidatus Uhrbacteria bacterium]